MRTNRHGGSSRGAALVVVFITVIVLSILSAAIFILFRANTRSQAVEVQRIRASYAAESGVNLAMHYMAVETFQSGQSAPFFLPGDSLGWIDVQSEIDKGSCFTVYLPLEIDA